MNIASSWDGTISSSDFRVACLSLADVWQKANTSLSPWSWQSCNKQPWSLSRQDEGYLSLENVCIVKSSQNDFGEGELGCSDEAETIDDDATLDVSHVEESYHYDFHIVYSHSYRVPVLYFRVYCSDGQPVEVENIEKLLPAYSSKVLLESKWTFITPEEHPYLNRPWYKLHPCGTSEWMKLLLLGDVSQARNEASIDQYLVSWLSVVGQVVGLSIPLEMLKNNNQL